MNQRFGVTVRTLSHDVGADEAIASHT
jgi:hypothetical protein